MTSAVQWLAILRGRAASRELSAEKEQREHPERADELRKECEGKLCERRWERGIPSLAPAV